MSRKMSEEGVFAHFTKLQRRYRDDVAEAVRKYCIGRSVKDVARILGRGQSWIQEHLDLSCVNEAREYCTPTPEALVFAECIKETQE